MLNEPTRMLTRGNKCVRTARKNRNEAFKEMRAIAQKLISDDTRLGRKGEVARNTERLLKQLDILEKEVNEITFGLEYPLNN